MSTPEPGTPTPPPPVAAVVPDPTAAAADVAAADVAARRRRLVVPIVFVVLLVAVGTGLAMWSLARRDSPDNAAGRPGTLVRVDTERDELLVYDELGSAVTATLELSDGGFPAPLGDGRLYDGTAIEDGDLRVYDLGAGTASEYQVSEDAGYVVPLGDHLLVVGSDSGLGELQVVDTSTGDVEALGDLVDLETRWTVPVFDPQAGAMTARATDADQATNVVVPASGTAGAWTVDGRLLDLWSGERAVVAVPVTESSSTLSMAGPDGAVGKPADFDGVVAGGLAVGDQLALVVDLEGSLQWFDAGSGTVATVDDLDVGEVQRALPLVVDRLLVVGDEATVLVDGEGTVLARWAAAQIDAPFLAAAGVHCVSLLPQGAGPADGGGILVDLGNGGDLVELDGRPIPSGDGCSVLVIGADSDQVVIGGEEIDLAGVDGRVTGLDPLRGRVLVLERGDAHAYRLVDLEGETVAELGDGPWILVS